jgi:hypothetical protein
VHYNTNVDLVKPTAEIYLRGFVQNLVCRFEHFYEFLSISQNLEQFGYLRQLENDFLKLGTVLGSNRPKASILMGVAAYHAQWPNGRASLGLAGQRERRRARTRPWSPRARGGVAGVGSPAASSRQGLCVERRCGEWETSGKEGAVGLTEDGGRR